MRKLHLKSGMFLGVICVFGSWVINECVLLILAIINKEIF